MVERTKSFYPVEVSSKYLDLYPNTTWYYNELLRGNCYFTNDMVEPLNPNDIYNHPLTKIFK